LAWTARREAEAAVAGQPADYKRYHQAHAASFAALAGKSVLVVGCNRGEDCGYFANLGASRVVGLDIMDEIGQNFTHAAVAYVRASVEHLPLKSQTFDLVFAYATLEHVQDIRLAFHEMARITAPGGFIYSAAAPLWCTRSGPHWGEAFHQAPWPHLRLDVEGVVALGQQALLAGSTDPYHSPDRIRQHLSDKLLFNRRRAHEYVDACREIEGIDIVRNDIDCEADAAEQSDIVSELLAMGYTRSDLFGLTHLFVAGRPRVAAPRTGATRSLIARLVAAMRSPRQPRSRVP
jgi:SAM-dependent methyltransferase